MTLADMSSPRSWGCFQIVLSGHFSLSVFPTLVGVFLTLPKRSSHRMGLPHARGGVSTTVHQSTLFRSSSPRSWGCFLMLLNIFQWEVVFPTLVGVFLMVCNLSFLLCRLPHARGGVSITRHYGTFGAKSSPRSWGCFCTSRTGCTSDLVFPTLVGVFLVVIRCA